MGLSPNGYENNNLLTINHEVVFEKTGLSMNLTDPCWQNEITKIVTENGVKVIVLDNLSSLCFGMEENSNDDWERMLRWLLHLRRQKIAVVVVHHAGTSGRMRGASRREDHAFWIIKCERVADGERAQGEMGVRFVTRFEKQRNSQSMEVPLEWHFVTNTEGVVEVGCVRKPTDELIYDLIEAGYDTAAKIAAELKISPPSVSRAVKRLESAYRVKVAKRRYGVAE
jgi:AAA domain-containing protein/iron dependent repressor-like protein